MRRRRESVKARALALRGEIVEQRHLAEEVSLLHHRQALHLRSDGFQDLHLPLVNDIHLRAEVVLLEDELSCGNVDGVIL